MEHRILLRNSQKIWMNKRKIVYVWSIILKELALLNCTDIVLITYYFSILGKSLIYPLLTDPDIPLDLGLNLPM